MSELEHAAGATDRPEAADERAYTDPPNEGGVQTGNTEVVEGDHVEGDKIEPTTPEPDIQTDDKPSDDGA